MRLRAARADPRALSKAHVMVIPSRAESLPYVILEAAAAAQPLISTDVGGINEIYGPDHRHRLIPANDPSSWRGAIRDPGDDPTPSARRRPPISPSMSARISASTPWSTA
jgi:glycosyltransferase involved in cell wall biosynthesis